MAATVSTPHDTCGTLSDYRLAQGEGSGGNPFNVIATNGSGSDVLNHVERLQFADTKIAIDLEAAGHAGQAMEFIGTIAPTLLGNTAVRGQIASSMPARACRRCARGRLICIWCRRTTPIWRPRSIRAMLAQAPAEMTQTPD